MVIELRAGATTLLLRANEQKWCRVSLETPSGGSLDLGASVEGVVVSRLRAALCGDIGDVVGQIAGLNVSWVTTLSEMHGSIYAADVNGDLELLFQDGKGSVVGRMRLSPTNRDEWVRLLDQKARG